MCNETEDGLMSRDKGNISKAEGVNKPHIHDRKSVSRKQSDILWHARERNTENKKKARKKD